jgi:hypothetical protein
VSVPGIGYKEMHLSIENFKTTIKQTIGQVNFSYHHAILIMLVIKSGPSPSSPSPFSFRPFFGNSL